MAVLYDGSSDANEVASAPVTGVLMTMACWFNTNQTATQQTMMAVTQSGSAVDRVRLGTDSAAHVQTTVEGTTAQSAATYSADTWHHAVGTSETATLRRSFLDGASGADDVGFTFVGTSQNTFSLGRSNDLSATQFFSGSIAEAAVWNVALTSAESAVLAAGYSPVFVRPGSLVAYVPMLRLDTGSDLHDRVGGLTLLNINTPATSAHTRIIYPTSEHTALGAGVAPPAVTFFPRRLGLLGVGR